MIKGPELSDYLGGADIIAVQADDDFLNALVDAQQIHAEACGIFANDWNLLIERNYMFGVVTTIFNQICAMMLADNRKDESRAPFHDCIDGKYKVKKEIVSLGMALHAIGGIGLMQYIHLQIGVIPYGEDGDARSLEYAWKGIGDWEA